MDTICQMYIIMIRHHAVYPVFRNMHTFKTYSQLSAI